MRKKLLTLTILAPLFYSACNSTTVAPKVNNTTPVSVKVSTIEKKLETTPTSVPSTSNEVTVTYANDKKIITKQGMMHIESFMETLQPTLMGLIKSDKTFKIAMGGCTSMATSMTNDYNNISDTKVRRTALKYRNEKNKPDPTDVVVMERFVASKDLKKPLVVEMNNHYRIYKALDVKQPCLACHGSNISKDLTRMLNKSYPKDLATDFKLGEFRGVVVAKVKK